MKDKTLTSARRFARQLSREELKTLQDISVGLNPWNSRKETKEQWADKFKEYKIDYKIYSRMIADQIKVMSKFQDDTKKEIQRAIAMAIHEKQEELLLGRYLMNTVRISLFRTLTRYFDRNR